MRHCSKTITVGGVTIPEGADVMIVINALHYMPQYWPDPYKFDPERFVYTLEPPIEANNFVHCSEVVPFLEVWSV